MAIYKGSKKISSLEIIRNIDDSSISEKTTYSSNKIETIREEVLDKIDNSIYGINKSYSFLKDDNHGYPTYILLYNITNWYNLTTESTHEYNFGFIGTLNYYRYGGYVINSYIYNISAAVNYFHNTSINFNDGSLSIFRSSYPSTISPAIISYQTSDGVIYYLALKLPGSGRLCCLDGRWQGGEPLLKNILCTDINGTLPSGYSLIYLGNDNISNCYSAVVSNAVYDANGNNIISTYATRTLTSGTATLASICSSGSIIWRRKGDIVMVDIEALSFTGTTRVVTIASGLPKAISINYFTICDLGGKHVYPGQINTDGEISIHASPNEVPILSNCYSGFTYIAN